MSKKFVAHVRKNDDGTWAPPQSLLEHLENTAKISGDFAAKFKSREWGKVLGLAHDAGKGRAAWQQYLKRKSGFGFEFDEEAHLEGKPGKMPHAIYGAVLAEDLFGKGLGRLLAYCIAGHHAGLPDWSPAEGAGQASLEYQQAHYGRLDDLDQSIINAVSAARPEMPPWKFDGGLDLSLWLRMLYSTLVDADFLDTESYMNESRYNFRGGYCSMEELLQRFDSYMEKLDETSEDTEVNAIRRNIRTKCVRMAGEDQGMFSLSVPTGGGKTLSSLAFALEHSIQHDLDRIIYVIPYTSIIEQNADVFRDAVGEEQVVEHHSNLEEEDATPKSRLASENWDAPIIVTTSVQFFESLFAAKSSRCRKLHNIARSVVVLDEAQLVPVDFLSPILETMQLLVDHYQVSFVISTATQPAFKERNVAGHKFSGLKNVREIMGDAKEVALLYQSLQRTRIEFPPDLITASNWEKIAEELQRHERVLCVVSDRKSCRELFNMMPKGTIHLSALMCGQHRSEVILRIKEKLKNGEAVRVISTQLVEAGVDLDFPVVYRAFAGLDSIAQAAGRCNREGKLPAMGQVVVFIPPRKPPIGILRKAAETTNNIISINREDPLNHAMFERYFSKLYWKANSLDREGIKTLLNPEKNDRRECSIYFRTAAKKFRIIDESTQGILVSYGDGEKLINLLKNTGPERRLMRKLQRFTVNIYNHEFEQLLKRGSIFEASPGIFALTSSVEYSEEIGLMVESVFDPEKYMP